MADSSKDDAMADVILEDLLQKVYNETELVKDDKGKGTETESLDNLENRIQNVEEVLYKAKEQMIMKKSELDLELAPTGIINCHLELL
ncbi:hypothetical protein Tco_0531133 [Tanacetum coccineum]